MWHNVAIETYNHPPNSASAMEKLDGVSEVEKDPWKLLEFSYPGLVQATCLGLFF